MNDLWPDLDAAVGLIRIDSLFDDDRTTLAGNQGTRSKLPETSTPDPAPKRRPLPLEFQGARHACARINSPAHLDRLQYLQR